MDEIINIYKPKGITPVQLIEQFRKLNPEYKDEKIGFAGRLDPLAHGVMILTVGEANKERAQYLNLNKTYKFKVLFGVETDTYDYLGILKDFDKSRLRRFTSLARNDNTLKQKLQDFINEHTGKFLQPYPPFSSKTLNGTPLFKLAKRKKIKLEDLPLREVEVFSFNLLCINQISVIEIKNEVLSNLRKIKGYFRQSRIIKQWQEFFRLNPDHQFLMAEFEIECSSGTYVRGLANKLGQELECGAIAFEILRTKVGEYSITKSLKI